MIAKCRQATRRQSRLTWCIEVIAVSAVVTDTAVDIGRTKASIGMAINTTPNPAALRTANAPIITGMKKTRPSRDKDVTSRISRPQPGRRPGRDQGAGARRPPGPRCQQHDAGLGLSVQRVDVSQMAKPGEGPGRRTG